MERERQNPFERKDGLGKDNRPYVESEVVYMERRVLARVNKSVMQKFRKLKMNQDIIFCFDHSIDERGIKDSSFCYPVDSRGCLNLVLLFWFKIPKKRFMKKLYQQYFGKLKKIELNGFIRNCSYGVNMIDFYKFIKISLNVSKQITIFGQAISFKNFAALLMTNGQIEQWSFYDCEIKGSPIKLSKGALSAPKHETKVRIFQLYYFNLALYSFLYAPDYLEDILSFLAQCPHTRDLELIPFEDFYFSSEGNTLKAKYGAYSGIELRR
ncbi:unnamed protein product [Moneuplotes crassus]|uniref:Uncharacterized protein n=1 Tax=Euplotes crassus TaxID=5936 RepID=A0AAD2D3K9_EUPCR|nr:unnamed protein product [Moneuplotes crassus]